MNGGEKSEGYQRHVGGGEGGWKGQRTDRIRRRITQRKKVVAMTSGPEKAMRRTRTTGRRGRKDNKETRKARTRIT